MTLLTLTDAAVYRGRRSLMVGLLSALWLWCQRVANWPIPGAKEKVESFIGLARKELELWGEGAIPQFLAHSWYLRATDGSVAPDFFLAGLLQATTRIQKEGDKEVTLLSPYYSLEDVRRHQLAITTRMVPDPLEDDSPRVASFFAEAVFHLLVRTGLKRTCKNVWPDLTKISHEGFVPAPTWGFCLWRSTKGTATTRLLMARKGTPVTTTHEESWVAVVEQARCIGTPEVPIFLRERPELLLLFSIVCPHRATPNVVRYLGSVFNEAWFIPPPLDAVPPT